MKIKDYLLFAFIFIFSSFILFYGINWGTPSLKKTYQIFSNKEELNKHIPKMIALREKFYALVREIHVRNNIKESIKEAYEHRLKSEPFKELLLDVKLDAMRGYFLGSINSDEQHNLIAISNMNPSKLDFNPNSFAWGGLHFYFAAANFLIGRIFGLLSLTRDISHYFLNPKEVANMYTIIRLISAFSAILSVFFLYFFTKKNIGKNVSVLSCIFLLAFPLIISNSKIAKPHILGMLFVLIGAYFAYYIFKDDKIKYYILSGIFFGLAFGCLYTNFISILILYFVEYTKNNFKLRNSINHKTIFATAIFSIVFLATNWYLISDFSKFLKHKEALATIFDYGTISFSGSMKFLKEFFSSNLPFAFLPVFLAGIWAIIKNKLTHFLPLIWFIFIHFLFIISYLKHPNVFIISLPFVAIILGYGVRFFIEKKFYVGTVYSVIVISYFLMNSILQTTLFVKHGNLTLCGDWINKNIPEGSSIGVIDGWFSPGNYPAFRFLNYKLIHLPSNEDWKEEKMPDYIILMDNDIKRHIPKIRENYVLLKTFHRPFKKIEFMLMDYNIATENKNINIYKKTSLK